MRDSLGLTQLGQFEEDEASNQERNNYSVCWIINLLLDVLLCSIAENF